MKRLTHKARYEAGYKLNTGVHEWQAIDRLAAYEDTGLTPEEIMDGKMLTGWIPVSERLPEDDHYVLICAKEKEGNETKIEISSYHEASFGGNKLGFMKWMAPYDYFNTNYDVIAWMPLPEPYKTE